MGLSWPDLSFLMLSIPQGENKRGVKAEATPLREASAILRLMRIIADLSASIIADYLPTIHTTYSTFRPTDLYHQEREEKWN